MSMKKVLKESERSVLVRPFYMIPEHLMELMGKKGVKERRKELGLPEVITEKLIWNLLVAHAKKKRGKK